MAAQYSLRSIGQLFAPAVAHAGIWSDESVALGKSGSEYNAGGASSSCKSGCNQLASIRLL